MTTLSDIISREEFLALSVNASTEKSALWQSGIIRIDPELNRLARLNTGNTFQFGYFNDLPDNEPSSTTDDCATLGTGNSLTSSTENAIKLAKNDFWPAADIVASMSALGDPLAVVASRVGAFWARRFDDYGLSITKGIVAANVANNASDMVHTAAAGMTLNDVIDAKTTMGDMAGDLSIIVCHSSASAALTKEGVTNRLMDDQGNLIYQDVADLRVIVSDKVPSNLGVYDAYIFSVGAIGWGWGIPKMPEEIERNAKGGNGGGCETFHSRREFVAHPYGHNFNSAVVASTNPPNPTRTELEDPLNWTRVKDRKNVKIAVLKHT